MAAQRYTQRDRHGLQLLSSASKEDDLIMDQALALRAYLGQTGMVDLQDNALELTPAHLTLETVIPRRLVNWFRFNVIGVECPALALAVYAQGDDALRRRAIYLRFQAQEVHDATTLRLEHFLVWADGRPRTITNDMEDLKEAIRGLGLWLVFLLGQIWIGVMGGFLEDIESHRFKGYPIPYLLRWVYEAMAGISKIGRDEPIWHEEPQQEMRDRVAKAFTDIKLHADEVQMIRYALASGQGSFHFGPAPASPAALPTAWATSTPVKQGSTTQASGSSGQAQAGGGGVCFGALGERYGSITTKCKLGAACTRLHFSQLPPGTTRAGLTAMLSALQEGQLRTTILEGIAKDADLAV
jgi:hypothetical protein